MPLEPGDRLGPYSILALLGVGGMGEVYRGRDTRLGRDVALKVLSPKLAGDPSFQRRFEVEARAASALNHPAIVTIYDVGISGGVSWIAMEWVEGETLRQRMTGGPLALRDALSIARQIAAGLAVAHAKGIVHRDLKPENVMLLADGRAKILDFGLARQEPQPVPPSLTTQAETVLAASFELDGTILGTVGYMSPEQTTGRGVDFRSDQFAFGLVLYEMLSGRRAFQRATAVETLAAVLNEQPQGLASLRGDLPRSLQRVVETCLAKRPEDRFRSTQDLVVALDTKQETSSVADETPTGELAALPPRAVHRPAVWRWGIALGAALGLLLAVGAALVLRAPRGMVDSLAVLPFTNASQDPDMEYLGDGLTENLIDQLSRVPSLKVMARATVFRYKRTPDPLGAARTLGVGAVLAGSVARRGDRITVSAELVQTSTGVRLWGERYDRPLADLLAVQDSIAADIADRLRLRLSADEKRVLSRHGTADPEAYELYLKARYLLLKETEEDDLEARRLYEQALARDPEFVDAYVGLATTYARGAVSGWTPPAQAYAQATEALKPALALDPDNSLVRCLLANRSFFFDWDWARAGSEYQELANETSLLRGSEFRPIGLYFWASGQTDKAIDLMQRALIVDPGNLDSMSMLADFLAQAGRLDAAVRGYRDLIEAAPDAPGPLFGLAEVLRRRGDLQGAITALRSAYELAGEEQGTQLLASARTAEDYDRAQTAVARSQLDDLEAVAGERYVSPLHLGRMYALAGEREPALTSLAAALAERSPGLVFLKVDRAWDTVRGDPRFASVVRQVGIP